MLIKKIRLLLISFAAIATAGCSSIKSAYDFDSSFDFTQVRSWQWNTKPSAEFAQANPLIDKRIVKAIENVLEQKLFTQTTPPDVNISYTVSIEKKLSSSGISTGIGLSLGSSSRRGHVSMSSGNQLKQTTEGTLRIDISSKTGALLWRGTGTRSLSHAASSPEKSQEKINEIVNELLKNFPPPQGTDND